MINRLNFYDLYAYLVPGTALLAALALPMMLMGLSPPRPELWSAITMLFLGYISGLALHEITRDAPMFSSRPMPSSWMLDQNTDAFSTDFKTALFSGVKSEFGLDIKGASKEQSVDHARSEAFRMCRQRVALTEAGHYPEQMQGMYGLARGISGASLFATCWYIGWIIWRLLWLGHAAFAAPLPNRFFLYIPTVLWGLLVIRHRIYGKQKSRKNKWVKEAKVPTWYLWSLEVVCLGFLVAARCNSTLTTSTLALLVAATTLVGFIFLETHKRYAELLVREVYAQFLARTKAVDGKKG